MRELLSNEVVSETSMLGVCDTLCDQDNQTLKVCQNEKFTLIYIVGLLKVGQQCCFESIFRDRLSLNESLLMR